MNEAQERLDAMVLLHQGLVRAIAWKIHRRAMSRVDLDDLIAYGQIGLLEAIRGFDAAKGTAFVTFAWYRIRGAILDGLNRMDWFDRAAYERGGFEVAAAAARESALPQPAGATRRGVSREDIEVASAAGDDPLPAEEVMHRELLAFLRQLVSGLPDREAALIRGMFYEGRTLTEAARRVGISTAWASRLQTRTLADLRVALEQRGFG
jgi:RNA polymerase sigma factor for flagellar operon FliA